MEAFTAKNREWEQQARDLAAQFTVGAYKVHNSRWLSVMVNADGVQFDTLYSGIVVESGSYGDHKTKTAALAYVLSEREARRFLRACFEVAEELNPFDPPLFIAKPSSE